jgi:succinate dehydrogenase / fumarate reductase, cytochrome b subunit
MSSDKRPTSPHLTIYKWQITMVLSILHRITGVALYVGTALIIAWLWTLAYAPQQHMTLLQFLTSPLGQIMLIGWTAALYFHLANGVRHLFWDAGYGFTLPVATKSGWAVLIFTAVCTFMTWQTVYSNAGQ